jgi:hypothetical protein
VFFAVAGVLAPAVAGPSGRLHLFFSSDPRVRADPVVVVVFDELPLVSLLTPGGEIDRKLFPSFARLADISTWYRNTTTNQTFTKEALPALLTGSYPLREVHTTFRYPRNLFSLLGASHEIRAADVPSNLCRTDLCDAPIRPPRVPRLLGFGPGEKGSLFFSFLSGLEKAGRPRLHFLHLVLPHGPWRYLPSGQRYDEVDPMPGEVDRRGRGTSWVRDRWLVAQAYQRHLMQTRLVDELVGALLVKLRRAGLLDDAVIVVTADHGIGWEPGLPKRLPTEPTAGTLAGVPMFVKAPGLEPGVVSDVPAETVDVLPTIADLLDTPTWPDVDGVSLLTPDLPRRRTRSVVDVPLLEMRKARRRAARAKYELVGHGGVVDLWKIAPGRSEELIGLRRDELEIGPPEGVTARASALSRLVDADPQGPDFPSFFEGILDGAGGRRPRVAVMVDGRIAAVTRAYESDGLTWFGVMLRPGLFGPREERVKLFVVDDVGSRALTKLPVAS